MVDDWFQNKEGIYEHLFLKLNVDRLDGMLYIDGIPKTRYTGGRAITLPEEQEDDNETHGGDV